MTLKFKTTKEFFETLVGDDWSFLDEGWDSLLFKVDADGISIFQYYNGEVDVYALDDISGGFSDNGGHLDLQCDNYWSIDFEIEDGKFLVGSSYLLKKPPTQEKKESNSNIIEL